MQPPEDNNPGQRIDADGIPLYTDPEAGPGIPPASQIDTDGIPLYPNADAHTPSGAGSWGQADEDGIPLYADPDRYGYGNVPGASPYGGNDDDQGNGGRPFQFRLSGDNIILLIVLIGFIIFALSMIYFTTSTPDQIATPGGTAIPGIPGYPLPGTQVPPGGTTGLPGGSSTPDRIQTAIARGYPISPDEAQTATSLAAGGSPGPRQTVSSTTPGVPFPEQTLTSIAELPGSRQTATGTATTYPGPGETSVAQQPPGEEETAYPPPTPLGPPATQEPPSPVLPTLPPPPTLEPSTPVPLPTLPPPPTLEPPTPAPPPTLEPPTLEPPEEPTEAPEEPTEAPTDTPTEPVEPTELPSATPTITPIPVTPTPSAIIIAGDRRWTNTQSPIVLDLPVQLTPGSTLIIEPGVEVRLKQGVSIFVDKAQLLAMGQEGQPVRFVTDYAGARWGSIYGKSGSFILMEHADISGGGAGGTVLVSEGGELVVRTSGIRNNGGAILVTDSKLEVRDSEIAANDLPYGGAIDATYYFGNLVTLINNRIGGNRLSSGAAGVRITNVNTFDGVGLDIQGNLIRGGPISDLQISTDGPIHGTISCNALIGDLQGLSIRTQVPQLPQPNLTIANNFIDEHTPPIEPVYLDFGIGRGATSELVIDMRNNWWGQKSGPYHPQENPEGRGDAAGVNIFFDPWLKEPPACAPHQ